MHELFFGIREFVEHGETRIVATHNAVCDLVQTIPLSLNEFMVRLLTGEQRIGGKGEKRLGGGGINFALSARAVGSKNTTFGGILDQKCLRLLCSVEGSYNTQTDGPATIYIQGGRINSITELRDRNFLHNDNDARNEAVFMPGLIEKLRLMGMGKQDWIACCSFYDYVTLPLIKTQAGGTQLSGKFFLDSGYSSDRKAKLLMTAFIDAIEGKSYSEIVVAANESEVDKIGLELGVSDGHVIEKSMRVVEKLNPTARKNVSLLLHTSEFSTLMRPTDPDFWFVPSMKLDRIVRGTNAGDTFAGAWVSAYAATGDSALACFYGNSAAGKRVADNELPTKDKMADFLKRVKMKDGFESPAMRRLGENELKERLSEIKTGRVAPPLRRNGGSSA